MYNLNYIKADLRDALIRSGAVDGAEEEILEMAAKLAEAAKRAEERGLGILSDQLNPEEDDDISLLYAYFLEKVLTGEDPEVIEELMNNVFLVSMQAMPPADIIRYYMICASLLAMQDGKSAETVYSLLESLIPTYRWGEFYRMVHEKNNIKVEMQNNEEIREKALVRYKEYGELLEEYRKKKKEDEEGREEEPAKPAEDQYFSLLNLITDTF